MVTLIMSIAPTESSREFLSNSTEFTLSSSVSVTLAKKWHEKKSILKTNSETRLNVLLIVRVGRKSPFRVRQN